jgi:DNA polymerase I-like protein with 3'-5' exonuclease and polymerase domains
MNLLFLGTFDDKPYLPRLKSLVGIHTCFVVTENITTWAEVATYCHKRQITGIFSTSTTLLKKLTHKEKVSLSNFAGSYFKRDGIEVVFVNPLDWLLKVNYGKFILSRYLSKLTSPESWVPSTKFSFSILDGSNAEQVFYEFQKAFLIAADIETFRENLAIRCIGYTAFFYGSDGNISSKSVILPIDSEWALAWMRKFNWELKAPKGFQNGKYDIAYLARYNAPVYNYLYDTINMSHCWYVELPKDLAFITTFFVRESWYWKDMADTNDLMQYYEYCARDTWGTGNSIIAWLMQSPEWAKQNYLLEFPLVFPSHMCEMRGLKVDMERLPAAQNEIQEHINTKSSKLDKMLGVTGFNVNSPKQMKQLVKTLTGKEPESCDAKSLAKFQFAHPLNNHILELIVSDPDSGNLEDFGIRSLRKLLSTYLVKDKFYENRLLYNLNPHGTDTGRNASSDSHFWCGLQIQNIPRGKEVKQIVCADPGFLLCESDLEQAESRDTAHIAGDERLIAAVSGSRDFHSVNASAFFGRKYEEIYDQEKHKTKDKPLRDLAKRVNHGANYNMGANVLVDTMGLKQIYKASALLGLPKLYTPVQIAEYLLAQFHKTYPSLKSTYYPAIIQQIETTKKLVGATGWTRYCFGDPKTNKRDLNAYVAHPPQSLNAMVLNQAFLKVFYEIALHPEWSKNFKLCAQIHDSILFQIREGHTDIAEKVKDIMQIAITVKGCDSKSRTFTVPAALKAGKTGQGAKYWSETE